MSSTQYNSQDMALRGRIGAYRLHSAHDSREITAAARRSFLARFEDEVDPERTLSAEERARRAQMALKAHMATLAYRSARSRRSGKRGGGDA